MEVLNRWEAVTDLRGSGYLAVQLADQPVVGFVFQTGQKLQSQLMRQYVAECLLNAPESWDWHNQLPTEREELESSVERLRRLFG
jgi:hypothetical protein